ncbi:hypothetical protein RSSM_04450 [Rhodopirellula sallentina SM41]|uniref:Uncharacterized protein n=1 Tax=Rhodopirellula sallentina SM41 TaxID=1263870 RepID=M5TY14_9BACT|nr:hypothetical protein RSSM_04450 [Rhodopirellula sallentina SM41]
MSPEFGGLKSNAVSKNGFAHVEYQSTQGYPPGSPRCRSRQFT